MVSKTALGSEPAHSQVRPDFERMLADINAGMVDAVLVWRTDRLTR